MADPFATVDQAASFGYVLPPDTADGLLARATQSIVDAAGFGILSESATVRLAAEHGVISLSAVPLVTAVSAVAQLHGDGTSDPVTGWRFRCGDRVVLDRDVPGGHCGEFAVTLTHGLPSVPESLVMLAASVAYRLAAMPAVLAAGITSQSVGSVSWSAPGAASVPDAGLTAAECARLARIVPVRTAWAVRL